MFDSVSEQEDYAEEPVIEMKEIADSDLSLIAFVEANPCIWNEANRDYKNKNMKALVFEDIGSCLPNPMSGLDAQRRWNCLRTLYARHRKKLVGSVGAGQGKSSCSESYYVPSTFAAIHRFLGPVFKPRRTFRKFNSLKRATNKSFPLSIKNIKSRDSEASVSSSESFSPYKRKRVLEREDPVADQIRSTTDNIHSLIGTSKESIEADEEKAMEVVLLHAFRRIPASRRTKVLATLLTTLEEFQELDK